MSPISTRGWHFTDVGCVRDHNEDNGFADPQGRLFIVCDGMGGHASGDVASQMAVEDIRNSFTPWPAEFEACSQNPDGNNARAALGMLESALRRANTSIHQRGRMEREKAGMGCTCDTVVVCGGFALCAHVGDSRTYLIRQGSTRQVTEDHSFAPPTLPGQPPQKGKLTSALGPNPVCRVDTFAIELDPDDRLLMCSDGLHDYFPKLQEIGAIILERGDEAGARALIELAKRRGGADNITIVLLKAEEVAVTAVAPPPTRPGPGRTLPIDQPSIVVDPGYGSPPPPAPPMPAPSLRDTKPAPPPMMAPKPPPPAAPVGTGVAIDRYMGIVKGCALFSGVPTDDILRIMGQTSEQRLPAHKPVPRQVAGADTAWFIVDGEYQGAILYPEALVLSQQGWSDLDSPQEDTTALPISRVVWNSFIQSEPFIGVKLLGNLCRLLAAELRDRS